MELKEINVVEGIFQQIIEEPFADIAVMREMEIISIPMSTMMCYAKIILGKWTWKE